MAERPERDDNLAAAVAERDAWRQAAFEAERFAAQTAIQRQHLADAMDDFRAQALEAARCQAEAESAADVEALRAELRAAQAERDRSIAERDRASREARDAGAALERVTSSTAWRVTGPARRVLHVMLRR